MKIWLTEIGECYPFQVGSSPIRTGHLASALESRGHDIVWWGANFYHHKKEFLFDKYTEVQVNPHYQIRLLEGLGYQKNVSFRRYCHHKIVARNFRIQASREIDRPDIIVSSLPNYELNYEAVRLGQAWNIPVIVDVMDLWPDDFLNHLPKALRGLARLALSYDFYLTRRSLRLADGIVSVSDGFLDWALKYANRKKEDRDHTYYIGFSRKELSKDYQPRPEFEQTIKKLAGKMIFAFIGSFGQSYDLELVVAVAKKMMDQGREDIHFVLAGTGEKFDKVLRESTRNVTLTGWLNEDEMTHLLSVSHVGLVPCWHMQDAVTTKPMQYLARGLPLLSSLRGEMEAIIDENEIGLSYPPGDISSFHSAILRFADDPMMREKYSSNALKIFHEKFDADAIYPAYIDHIESVVKMGRR